MNFNELPINKLNALKIDLDMYTTPPAETMVLESIANSIDEKATELKITLDSSKKTYTLIDNGNGMSKKTFGPPGHYHTLNLSSKNKGNTIGFAGIGAKIYLAAWSGAKIWTETFGSDGPLASLMQQKNNTVGYTPFKPSINKKGTNYTVLLSEKDFIDTGSQIKKWIIKHYNYALDDRANIWVEGKKIKAWKPEIENNYIKKLTIKTKKKSFPAKFWISKTDLQDRYGLEIVIFGKTIIPLKPEWNNEVKKQYQNRFGGVIHANELAEYLTSNKQEFARSRYLNSILGEFNRQLYIWVKKIGILIDLDKPTKSEQTFVQNELTRTLDRLIAQKEFKFMNPWSVIRNREVAVKDPNGSITGTIEKGHQPIGQSDGNGGTGTTGPDEGDAYTEGQGATSGSIKTRKSRGIGATVVNFPNDPREGWLEPEDKVLVYNEGHPFALKMAKATGTFRYNVARVLISILVKFGSKNKQDQSLSCEEALDFSAKLLAGCSDTF